MRPLTSLLLSVFLLGSVLLGSSLTWTANPDPRPRTSDKHASPHPDHITLSWTQNPSSSFSVSWRTDTTVTTPKAQIAPAKAGPSLSTKARTIDAEIHPPDIPGVDPDSIHLPHQHQSVTFSGLAPDSTYAYRVGDGTHWSEWFHAETASPTPEPFTFLYLGDAQNGLHSHWPRALRAAYAAAPNAAFLVQAGDLVNHADRMAQWADWHEAGAWIQGNMPTLAVPGNREYSNHKSRWSLSSGTIDAPPPKGRALSMYWRPQFTFPKNGPKGLKENVYYLDYQGLRLIGLDAMAALVDSTARHRQTRWLKSVLAQSEARWTAVVLHMPIFSTAGDFAPLRQAWRPLLDKYQVDLVMQGQNHTYARGHVQSSGPETTDASSGSGTVYVTSIAGSKMMPIRKDRWSDYDDIVLKRGAENTQLYQVVRVEYDTMRYRAYTVTGERYDAFDLVKRPGDAPNALIDRVPADASERTFDNTIPYEKPE